MRGTRMGALIVAAALGTVGALAPGCVAGADGPGEPIFTDINHDGLIDELTLGVAVDAVASCTVEVRLAEAEGVLLPPVIHTYLTLPADEPNCPDLGVAVDLHSSPDPQLVVGWFAGRPSTVDFDLLVLRNYTLTGGFEAIFQPSYLGLADFDGDGRPDLYEWTDQGEGFATYLNTGIGTAVPGPVRYCAGPLQYRLTDFNRNGATDLVIAYLEGCGDYFSGVAVVLDDGTVLDLEGDLDGFQSWTVDTPDANGDGVPDVVTYDQSTGAIRTFIGVGNGTFVTAPRAIRDYPTVRAGRSTRIDVLVNDYATSRARVSIVTPPQRGTVRLTADRSVIYTPDRTNPKTDRFVYRITDAGRTSNATVTLKIVS
jgi:hypothetical protein